MPAIPQGFPRSLSDDALDGEIEEMIALSTVNDHDFGRILPELQLAILNAALQERARRDADVAQGRALIVSLTALGVSVASLAVAVVVVLTA